jgi:hypothetical protein
VYVFTLGQLRNETLAVIYLSGTEQLTQAAPPEGRLCEKKTSAKKQKKVSKEDLLRLFRYTLDNKNRYGKEMYILLRVRLLTGLRPIEWVHAVLTGNKELKVINAKAIQGRAHGEDRHLNFGDFSEEEILLIKYHLPPRS